MNEEERKNEWNKTLSPYGLELIHSRTNMLKNISIILLSLGLLVSLGVFLYFIYNGDLTPQVSVNSTVNNPVNVNNAYEFTPDNKVTIVVDLHDLECIGGYNVSGNST